MSGVLLRREEKTPDGGWVFKEIIELIQVVPTPDGDLKLVVFDESRLVGIRSLKGQSRYTRAYAKDRRKFGDGSGL